MSTGSRSFNATRRPSTRRVTGGVVVGAIALAVSISTRAADAAASSASSASEPQAQGRIAFANRGGILDWHVLDDSHLLVEDNHRQWYLVTLQSPSIRLAFAEQLGFDTGPSGSLERFSAIVVDGVSYRIVSLVKADPPAKGHR